jgi:hypothetical protein
VAWRRAVQLPAGAFDRTVDEWRELKAPAFLYDRAATCAVYSAWALLAWGGGKDPADRVLWWMAVVEWLPTCARPRFLFHALAVTEAELDLLDQDHRWDWPDHCRYPLLRPAAPVPEWLAMCRMRPRGGAA